MSRNLFVVNATQVVVSDSHPEGLFSTMTNYPKTYDSLNYDGSTDAALKAAKSEYYSRLSSIYSGSAARVMATVTLSMANGRQVLNECVGAFPVVEAEEEAEA